ncbi:flagellar hook-associated protein FlgK [Nocardioidaceae bacterium]|nr:flagellar hook-associated protein FlgK [Nocardioidaceae bacterium]
MAGTFGSLGIALSAMRYSQSVMDVAGNNIANVGTEGYVRRRVEGASVGAPVQPALWSRYDRVGGDGVAVAGLTRMVEEQANVRSRREHGSQTFLDTRATSLSRLESGIGEPGPDGLAAALADLKASFDDLANNPGDQAARQQVLVKAAIVGDALRGQAGNVLDEMTDQQVAITEALSEVETLASDLAATNKAINTATLTEVDASTLMDNRDRIALRLAELTGGSASLRPDGGYDFTVGSVALVQGQQTATLTATDVPPGSGEIAARTALVQVDLAAHLDGLNRIAADLAAAVNTAHRGGHDQDGNPGGDLVAVTAGDEARTLRVVVSDPRQVAASSVSGPANLDAGNADALADAVRVDADYRRLVSGFGATVASTTRLATNQRVLTDQVDAARDQGAGVNLDEEMTNMLAAQRGYEAAARLMRTLDEVLDTLINRTGIR